MTRGVRTEVRYETTRSRTFRRKSGVETYRLKFTYYGGTYIDIGFMGVGSAFEVINVWRYDEDKSAVTSRGDFIFAVNEWMEEQNRESLRLYWENEHPQARWLRR